jgi:hypothetical protein
MEIETTTKKKVSLFAKRVYGFYSQTEASTFGFKKCALYENPSMIVSVTNIYRQEHPPQIYQIPDLVYRGIIIESHFRKATHEHLLSQTICRTCTYRDNFGIDPPRDCMDPKDDHLEDCENDDKESTSVYKKTKKGGNVN